MNKLGFYLEVANTPGLPEAIEKVKPPTLLIHAGNRGLLHDIRRRLSPDTFVIGRWFVDQEDQGAWLTSDDPKGKGIALAERILSFDHPYALERINGRLLIDAWMSLNECVPGPASEQYKDGTAQDKKTIEARAAAYDLFQVGFRERLKAADGELEAVAFNFGAGNFQTARDYLDWFPKTLESYVYLGFHEYGWPYLSKKARPKGSKVKVESSAGTYRAIMKGIAAEHGDRHRVIITEAGLARMYKHPKDKAGDVGWLHGPDSVSQKGYRRSLRWYNRRLCKDDYVLGACLFEVGHGGAKWETFRHLGVDNDNQPIRIIDWIAKQRVKSSKSKPKPDPEPGPGKEGQSEPATGTQPDQGGADLGAAKIDARIASLITVEADEANAYRLEEIAWMDPGESNGLHHIFVDVVDGQDKRVVGDKIRVSWSGGTVDVLMEAKPKEPWGANFAMFATMGSYAVEVAPEDGLSDKVAGLGMGTPDEPGVTHHTSFGLRFRKL